MTTPDAQAVTEALAKMPGVIYDPDYGRCYPMSTSEAEALTPAVVALMEAHAANAVRVALLEAADAIEDRLDGFSVRDVRFGLLLARSIVRNRAGDA